MINLLRRARGRSGHGWSGRFTARFLGTLLGLAACLQGSVSATARGDQTAYGEYEVKAAFLYNFIKFVEWPDAAFPDAGTPISIGVLGKNPFGPELETIIKDKTVKDRKVVVKRSGKIEDLRGCHLLFINSSEQDRLPEIIEDLRGKSVLTVGETKGFAQQGGVINFIMIENKLRFEINVDAAQRAGLKISSKLLGLAKIIRDK